MPEWRRPGLHRGQPVLHHPALLHPATVAAAVKGECILESTGCALPPSKRPTLPQTTEPKVERQALSRPKLHQGGPHRPNLVTCGRLRTANLLLPNRFPEEEPDGFGGALFDFSRQNRAKRLFFHAHSTSQSSCGTRYMRLSSAELCARMWATSSGAPANGNLKGITPASARVGNHTNPARLGCALGQAPPPLEECVYLNQLGHGNFRRDRVQPVQRTPDPLQPCLSGCIRNGGGHAVGRITLNRGDVACE